MAAAVTTRTARTIPTAADARVNGLAKAVRDCTLRAAEDGKTRYLTGGYYGAQEVSFTVPNHAMHTRWVEITASSVTDVAVDLRATYSA